MTSSHLGGSPPRDISLEKPLACRGILLKQITLDLGACHSHWLSTAHYGPRTMCCFPWVTRLLENKDSTACTCTRP